jgi:hypothetical protein
MNTTPAPSYKTNIILGIIVFFVLVSLSPTFYEWSARSRLHAERSFELVHNFPTDYNLYLSRIREGKEGAWLATEKYTSEEHTGSLSQILYVMIGRLADYAHVQTPYIWFAYHVARAFFAGFLLYAIWLIVEWMFRKATFQWQLLSYLLIVTSSTWPKFEWVADLPRFGGYMSWYTMADSLQRTTFMPHITLAQGLLTFIILVFSGGFVSKYMPANWVFLGIVGIILGIVFPPGLLFIYVVLGLVTLIEWAVGERTKEWKTQWFEKEFFGRLIFGILTLPTVVYYYLLFLQYPWKRLVEFDVLHPTKFSYIEYFMAVGPVLPLGILAILVLVIWKRDELQKFKYTIAWIVGWLGLLFIFNQIPQQSPTRFTQMAPHIGLGIMASWMFMQIGKKFKHIAFIPVAIIIFGLGSMASSYMWLKDFVDHKIRATLPIIPSGAQVMYPMKEIIEALTWVQVYTPRQSVVLSGMSTGNLIPVYAGNTAYVGHANTVNLENKLLLVERFYKGDMKKEEAMRWAQDEKISYVFYGWEERAVSGGTMMDLRLLYPGLEQVYESQNVRVYKLPVIK